MGFLTTTANFQPKEGLSEQLLNPELMVPLGNPHAPPLWPELEGDFSTSPATLGTAWGMQQRPRLSGEPQGVDGGHYQTNLKGGAICSWGGEVGPRQGQQLEGKGQARFSVAVVISLNGLPGAARYWACFSVSLVSFTFRKHPGGLQPLLHPAGEKHRKSWNQCHVLWDP